MKKNYLMMLMAMSVCTAYGQILQNNMLSEYKEGDVLEKGEYTNKDAEIKKATWNMAFTNNPSEAKSPTVGKPLIYPEYNEGGASIILGNFPEGVKGARTSTYSLTKGKEYAKGTLYLSFLVNFSKLSSSNMTDFIGLSAGYTGSGNRSNVFVARDGSNSIRFGVSLIKPRVDTEKTYDYDKTHLLVVKLDYTKNEASLFVNPDLSGTEPQAEAVVTGSEEYVLKHAIRAISVRNRNGFSGNIGNFRLSNSWAGVVAQ